MEYFIDRKKKITQDKIIAVENCLAFRRASESKSRNERSPRRFSFAPFTPRSFYYERELARSIFQFPQIFHRHVHIYIVYIYT